MQQAMGRSPAAEGPDAESQLNHSCVWRMCKALGATAPSSEDRDGMPDGVLEHRGPEPKMAKEEFLRHLRCKTVVLLNTETGPLARKSCRPRAVRGG